MTTEQFLELMVRSQLFGQPEFNKVVAEFREDLHKHGTQETVDALTKFLVETGRLTEWQCAKLGMGKWKGFCLDNFLILEQCGKDDVTSSYKARDARSGSLARLVITPPNFCADGGKAYRATGQIEYRVEPYIE
jgi:hypothetical protein